eukprot:1139475-Pelagomonas_calceolata.AAC.1
MQGHQRAKAANLPTTRQPVFTRNGKLMMTSSRGVGDLSESPRSAWRQAPQLQEKDSFGLAHHWSNYAQTAATLCQQACMHA